MRCLFGGVCLLGGDGAKCCEHCGIDRSCVVEEGTCYFLDDFFVDRAEWRGSVSVFCVLCFYAVDWFDVWVGLVSRFAWMSEVEALESSGDIGEHGEVDFAFCVVPVETKAEVPTAGPIFGKFCDFPEALS